MCQREKERERERHRKCERDRERPKERGRKRVNEINKESERFVFPSQIELSSLHTTCVHILFTRTYLDKTSTTLPLAAFFTPFHSKFDVIQSGNIFDDLYVNSSIVAVSGNSGV